jgi:hypothetical protein
MADVVINKFTTQILRDGATPSSPGFVVSEGQDPVNPPGTNNFVPYSGATGTVDLGAQTIEAGSFVKDGGTSSQFLKADGSVDSTSYQPLLTNPVTGTGSVGQVAYWSSGSEITGESNLFWDAANNRLGINESSPDHTLHVISSQQCPALFQSNTAGGGIALMDSTTTNDASVGIGAFGDALCFRAGGDANGNMRLHDTGNLTLGGNLSDNGVLLDVRGTGIFSSSVTASSFVKSGGTSSQYLMADGSVSTLTNPVTGTGTTNYLPKFTGASTIGNSNLINDSSGNLGLGVTPSAWFSGVTALQFGSAGALWSNSDRANLASNVFVDAATNTKYIVNGFALRYAQESGQHAWSVAPSGTAGNVISFTQAMTLFSTGNLGIGVGGTDAGYKLDVNGTGRFSSTGNALTIASTSTASNVQLYITNNNNGDVYTGVAASDGSSVFTGTTAYSGYIGTNLNVPFYIVTNGTARVTISSAGAATFSSSVTAGGSLTVNAGSNDGIFSNITGAVVGLKITQSSSSNDALFRMQTNGHFYDFRANSSNALSIDYDGGSRIYLTSGGNVLIGTTTDAAGVRLRVEGGVIRSLATYNNTVATAANLVVSAGGTFERSTSSLKYKTEVKDYDKGLEILNNLRPVYYKGKSQSDGNKQFAGLIAEEVHDLGLSEFVQYANDGTPDALAYTHMIALLINSIKELKQEIDTLKNN